jgi:hypothetical protein
MSDDPERVKRNVMSSVWKENKIIYSNIPDKNSKLVLWNKQKTCQNTIVKSKERDDL